MSLKKSLFTKATLCPEDTGAVEDIQVGISTAGHLPKTVLRVVANVGYAKFGISKTLLPHTMEDYGVSAVLI